MADGTRQATVPQLESSGNQPVFGLHTLKVFRTAQAKRNRDPRNRTKTTWNNPLGDLTNQAAYNLILELRNSWLVKISFASSRSSFISFAVSGDAVQQKQLQICDVLAGACSAVLRFDRNEPGDAAYREKLLEAGIDNLVLAGLFPSTDVTPESLGRKGWDGNIALEWLTEQMRAKQTEKS